MSRERVKAKGRRSVTAEAPVPEVELTSQLSQGVIIYEPDNGTGEELPAGESAPPPPYSEGGVTGRIVSVFGPNLTPNPDFEVDLANWVAGPSEMDLYRFGTTIESWGGTAATPTWDGDVYPLGDEAGSLLLTATGVGTSSGHSPARAVTVGDSYIAAAYVASSGEFTAQIGIAWLTGAFAYISSSSGTSTTLETGQWTPLFVAGTAPATAAYGLITVSWTAAAGTEYMYVAAASMTGDNVSTLTRTTTAGEFHSGVAALKVVSTGAGLSTAYAPTGTIDVEEGESISIQFRYRQDDGSPVGALCLFYDDDETLIGMSTRGLAQLPAAAVTTWSLYSEAFRVPDNAVAMKVAVGFEAGGVETLFVDEVLVRRASLITASVVRTSDGGPRAELSGGTLGGRLRLYASSRPEDTPGEVSVTAETLDITGPTQMPTVVPARLSFAAGAVTPRFGFNGAIDIKGSSRNDWGHSEHFVPRGFLGQASEGGDKTTSGATELTVVTCPSIYLEEFRWYKATFTAARATSSAGDDFKFYLYADGVEVYSFNVPNLPTPYNPNFTFHWEHSSASVIGDMTVTIARQSGAGTATIKSDIWLSVEDVGGVV